MAAAKLVLFICTGNICRSPMAEGLFRAMLKDRTDIEVGSAGLGASDGQAPSTHSIEALRPAGVDIRNIRSRALTEEMAERADYIFVMTRGHLDTIHLLLPQVADKTFLVCEFDEKLPRHSLDVPDPIGQSYDVYVRCRETIKSALPGILAFIDKTSQKSAMTPTASTSTKPLRIALGGDHGGFELKHKIQTFLTGRGHIVSDFGSFSEESVDYPDYAEIVCKEVIAAKADFGILLCKSGIGMSIAANRYPHIRAALVSDPADAETTRRHNNSNVLCLAAKELNAEESRKIVETFLQTAFEGGRHQRRVEKLDHIAEPFCASVSLSETDPAIHAAIMAEEKRQFENIELIASENFTSRAVMEAQGSCLTNKYAEGYPGRRWYGGCENVDVVEQLAIDRCKELFGAEFANVQPHSGSQANMAVYFSVLQPGDKILTMDLAHGGHLTHGHKANFSGRFYHVLHYGVSQADERIDYDALQKQANEFQPKMITAGASAYPRIIDWERMAKIAQSVGAYLFVDMAHIAGLVAAGVHPSPIPFADFVTTTTHKSLRGPRAGVIMAREKYAKAIDGSLFPGIQGGPLQHVIAAKAVCFLEALKPSFKAYQQQIVSNAKAMAAGLAKNGYRIVSGGTDNHLMLVDLRPMQLDGKTAQETLDKAGITVNKNGIPFDTMPISKAGGIRVGTPAVTTRGMKEEDMMEIADLIHDALLNKDNDAKLVQIRDQVRVLTRRFPLP